MVADDTAAKAILEEDRQAEAIFKEFAKGNSVHHLQYLAANQHAKKNIMSPGRRVARDLVVKGTKKGCGKTSEEKETS
jgi:hypothetical protein